MGKGALLLGALLGENVAFERVLSLDLSGTRQLKSLLRTGLGLCFWHDFLLSDI